MAWGQPRPQASHQFNFNVPELQQACISGLPSHGVAVFRGSSEQTVEFCEALRQRMTGFQPGQCAFDNIDISQVVWDSLSVSLLIDILQEKQASTKRFKAFKCRLDDDAIRVVAGWLETLPPANMPSEVHLSHNDISQDGFSVLLEVLQAKRALLSLAAIPIWLRVENNRVGEAFLSGLVESGVISMVPKVGDRRPGAAVMAMPSFQHGGAPAAAVPPPDWPAAPGAMARVVAFGAGSGAAGVPVAPVAAAQAGAAGGGSGANWWEKDGNAGGGGGNWWEKKDVGWKPAGDAWKKEEGDSWKKDDGWNKSGEKGAESTMLHPKTSDKWSGAEKSGDSMKAGETGKDSKNDSWNSRPQQAAGPAKAASPGGSWATVGTPKAAAAAAFPGGAFQMQQVVQPHAKALAATVDRSRSPAPRTQMLVPQQPKEAPLPPGWEEQFSDEYNIPYFWNTETQESSWERPKK
mmetsp:Transcript_88205/g.224560  ORF Transcript_88205/g.224560 Transcript_88205/m.224560 type:complete len:463 (-) Transcript_88205:79-1467(-)